MRILVVDDHQVVRRGIRSLLEAAKDVEVCGEAVDGRDAIVKTMEQKPDTIIMDISMPNLDGIEATRKITGIFPGTHVVILSQHDFPHIMRQAINAGASAYVVKSAVTTDLITAIDKIREGEQSGDPAIFGSAQRNVDVQQILRRSAALETALRESEERFRLTFEQAAVGIAHVAPDGRWLRVNQKLCDILGYTPAELLRLKLQEITHPADLAADRRESARLAKGETTQYSLEKRYIRKDRQVVWCQSTAAAVYDDDQQFQYFVRVVEDITARKQAERALQESERRLQIAQQVARSGTFEWNIKTGVDRWTPELEIIYGLTPGQFGGTIDAWEQLLHPDDREDVLRRVQEALQGGAFEGEWRVLWPDGSVRWLLGRAWTFRDETGAPERMIGVHIDITERKLAEDRLSYSEHELGRENADLKLLQEISTQLIQQENVQALYERITEAAAALMRSDFAGMQLLESEPGKTGELALLAFRGFNPKAVQFWQRLPAGSASISAIALRTGKRVIVADVAECGFLADTEDLATYVDTGIRAVQSTPLLSRTGQIVGMISTHWRQVHTPTERELRMFDVLARQASDLIEHRRAEEALRRVQDQLRANVPLGLKVQAAAAPPAKPD